MLNFSIWLLPESRFELLLNSIIKKTTNYFSCSPFDAHCTLASGVNQPLAKTKGVLNSYKTKAKLIRCDLIGLVAGESPWKSFYISIKNNSEISRIQNYISEKLLSGQNYDFDPHMSLVYGSFDEIDLRNNIKFSSIPKEVIFDKIAIVDTSRSVKDWTIVYETNI